MARSSLLLPPELVMEIRDRVCPYDLRTHVCLYLAHPAIAALYDSAEHPDAFWGLACWHCGIGKIESERKSSWKDIAIACIVRDGFCQHPQCGEALLEYNRERMRQAAEDVQPLCPLQIRDYNHQASLDSHRVFAHIRFRRYGDHFRPHSILNDAHLTYPPGSAVPQPTDVNDIWGSYIVEPPDDYPGLYIEDHPLVTHSFATSSPITSAMLLNLCGYSLRERLLVGNRALTVLDILSAMHRDLDCVLNMDEVREYVELHAQCFPQDWDVKTAFRTLRSIRSCLTICPLERLEHQENTEFGPAFTFNQV